MRRCFAGLLLLAATMTLADAAFACSCGRNPTAESILDQATAVFTGVAQKSVPARPGQSITTFKITERFKGPAAGTVVRVQHPSGSSASCGVKFSAGETYTLAAHQSGGGTGLGTSQCSTWMFMPQVGLSAKLINRMRILRDRR